MTMEAPKVTKVTAPPFLENPQREPRKLLLNAFSTSKHYQQPLVNQLSFPSRRVNIARQGKHRKIEIKFKTMS